MIVYIIPILLLAAFLLYFQMITRARQENFEESEDMHRALETLEGVFDTYLFRKPTAAEIRDLIARMEDPQDIDTILDQIKKTPEFKRYKKIRREVDAGTYVPVLPIPTGQTERNYTSSPSLAVIMRQTLNNMDTNRKIAIFGEIVEMFGGLLKRFPTAEELHYYTLRMHSDKKFTPLKLFRLLRASEEYQRRVNNTYQPYAELDGDRTYVETEFEIKTIYERMTKNLNPPAAPLTRELYDFLYYKYRQYEFDSDRLKTLITRIYETDIATARNNAEKAVTVQEENIGRVGDFADEYFQFDINPTQDTSILNLGMSTE